MDEILGKLQEMGVSIDTKGLKAYFKQSGRSVESITDGDLPSIANALNSQLAAATAGALAKDAAAVPIDFSIELQAIEALGESEGVADAALIFGARERGYLRGLQGGGAAYAQFRKKQFATLAPSSA